MVIVQHIETTWYKNERGAMHGTLRGKTPEAVQIPIDDIAANDEETIVHMIHSPYAVNFGDFENLVNH